MLRNLWKVGTQLLVVEAIGATIILLAGGSWFSALMVASLVAVAFLLAKLFFLAGDLEDILISFASATLLFTLATLAHNPSTTRIVYFPALVVLVVSAIVAAGASKKNSSEPFWMLWITAIPVVGSVFGGVLLPYRRFRQSSSVTS